MLETGTSGLMSGEGKPPAASRSRSSALPRLYADGQQTARSRWAGKGQRPGDHVYKSFV